MGKQNKEYESDSYKKGLLEQKKAVEKKLKQVHIPCSHTNSKGKLKVNFIRGTLAECKKCGQKFDFETIPMDDLSNSIQVVHNAINQVKAFTNDPEAERKIIRQLGEIDYQLTEIRDLYKRATEEYLKGGGKNKNKNNKNRNNDNFGSYGIGALGIGGGGKRR